MTGSVKWFRGLGYTSKDDDAYIWESSSDVETGEAN